MKVDCAELAASLLAGRNCVKTVVVGNSMWPLIIQGDAICIEPAGAGDVRVGDIVVFRRAKYLVAHRLVGVSRRPVSKERADDQGGNAEEILLLTKGDTFDSVDGPVTARDLIGRVYAVEKKRRMIPLNKGLGRFLNKLAYLLSPLSSSWLGRRNAARFEDTP